MPRTVKREKRPAEKLGPVPDEILDHFAPDRPMTADEIDTAGRRLKKALMERMLGAELSHHLGLSTRRDQARGDDESPQRHERKTRADRRWRGGD